jgi:putative DNA primase/helicase
MELSELDTMKRGDIGTIKAFMSRPTDRFRMPYGRRTSKFPRQCIFAGTINPEGDGYLKDPTGGRRFWPVKCTKVDADALKENTDQLWAEAVAMFEAGYPWWLDTPELEAEAAAQQSERYQGDAWDGLILRHLTHYKTPVTNSYGAVVDYTWVEREKPLTDISVAEILTDVLEIEKARWNKADQMRIGGILTALKFERYRVKINGERGYRYAKPCPTLQGKHKVGHKVGHAKTTTEPTL